MNNFFLNTALLFSSQLQLNVSTSNSQKVILTLNKTATNINSYLHQLDWYFDMAKTGFMMPLEADNTKYILSSDNMSLTIMNINVQDAGVYTARYDGLLLYPQDKSCEQQLLEALRHYPVFQPVTFTVSVDGNSE